MPRNYTLNPERGTVQVLVDGVTQVRRYHIEIESAGFSRPGSRTIAISKVVPELRENEKLGETIGGQLFIFTVPH